MSTRNDRIERAFSLIGVLLSLGLISCRTTKPHPKEELMRSLEGANVKGYLFATKEDDRQAVASLTNSVVRNVVTLDSGAASLVLKYTRVEDKEKHSARTYRAEVAAADGSRTLQVTDVATSEVISKEAFPVPEPHGCGGREFDSVDACVKDFECTSRGAVQCEANRSCRARVVALKCRLRGGECISLHIIVPPTAFRCELAEVVPDVDGLVLRQ